MIFVGADVHVRNSYLYATDFEGKRLVHGRVPNSLGELRSFCDELMSEVGGEVQPVRFVLESTTNSRPVQSRRAGIGFDDVAADVLNARKLRIIAESVAKCDAIDGRALNQLARSNLALPTCYMPDDEEFALRESRRAGTGPQSRRAGRCGRCSRTASIRCCTGAGFSRPRKACSARTGASSWTS